MANHPSAGCYTIEVWWRGMDGSTESNEVGAFDDEELGDLLREMGISAERHQEYIHRVVTKQLLV